MSRSGAPVLLTVDVAAFAVVGDDLAVVLVERAREPFVGRLALPGGFVEPDEAVDLAARRELAEETGLRVRRVHPVGVYADPGRDPRPGRVVSVAHLALLAPDASPVGADDAATAALVPVGRALDRRRTRLAFDHHRILADAAAHLARLVAVEAVATGLCPAEFTLAELRRAYEAVWGTPLDGPNFRRRVLAADGFVVATGRLAAPPGRGGRPAELFRPGRARTLEPPLERPRRS